MDMSERMLREILKQRGTFVRSGRHEVYQLDNGRRVAIRVSGRRGGHHDQWKSALSYVKRTLRLPDTRSQN